MKNNKLYAVYYNGLGGFIFTGTKEEIEKENKNRSDDYISTYANRKKAQNTLMKICGLI